MLTIPLIPSAFLALLAAVSLFQAIQVRSQLSQTEENNDKGHDIAGLIHQLQQERNEVSFAIIKNNSVDDLTEIFLLTDHAINSLEWPGDTPGGGVGGVGGGVGGGSPMNGLLSRETFVRTLTSGRYSNDFQLELKIYSELNAAAILWLIQTVQNNNDDSFWEDMIAYILLIRAKENIGIYAPLGSEYFVLGHLSEREFVTYIQNLELSKDHLDISLQYSSFLAERYNQTIERNVETFSRFQQLQEVAVLKDDGFMWNQTVDYSQLWVTTVEEILDHLKELEDMLEDHILELVAEGLTVASQQINLYVLAIACVAVIVPLISYISWRVTTNMQRFARGLEDKTQLLHQEKKRSDSLLYRMLPRSVAIQLKGDHEVRAENYEAVTIYFSDIVGFTVLSSNSSPMQVVSLLNALYNLFDSRIEVYDVYKVETIGDSYMVASGLPNRNGDKHAGEIATLALDLMDRLRYFQVPHRPEEKLQLRVGLHTGTFRENP
ncbi:hypothetical protein BSL78_17074 [Apostichopus japonicus]|uniref:guanylate cyclase n=1 Tax=Stichopus japonicus TaxID=307972 RepID=A0A2G8KDK7_STIJA|nr:hypothetical protein BSL78_17074 [Apostichopus japonicus]